MYNTPADNQAWWTGDNDSGTDYSALTGISEYPGVQSTEFNPNANVDDGSCDYEGCTDPAATNYTLITHFTTGVQYAPIIDDGSCLYGPAVPGCMDPDAVNHSSFATVDDGSCDFEGCLNPIASNYTLISHAITGVL